MSIQAFAADFLGQQNVPIVDPQTGTLTRNGRTLLQALWSRTGQGTGIIPNVSPPLTASGSTIADALQLTTDWNYFGTIPGGTGCKILPLKPGNDIQVFNGATPESLSIYPPTALDQIDALGAGQPFILAPGKLRIFECWGNSPAQFYSFGN